MGTERRFALPRIIGIGHSHLICFDDAADDLLKASPNRFDYVPICFVRREYHPPFELRDGTHVANPVWVDAVAQQSRAPDVSVLLAVPGAEWWYWSLTPGPDPFDFVDPADDDKDPLSGQVVSYDLVLAKARAAFHYVRRIADAVRGVCDAPLFLSPPPPPMRDVASLFRQHMQGVPGAGQSRHGGLRHVLNQLAPTIEQYGFRADSFRMKSWRVAMRAVREICDDANITYLAPPDGGVDAGGFLRPDMIADLVHANRAWGRLQLERLLSSSRQPQGALT